MTNVDSKRSAWREPLAALIFFLVCALLSPVFVIGYGFWIVKAYAGRGSGVSATAQGPLSARWFQHQLGVRRDEAANRLLMALPGISPLAVRLVFGPLLLASRLSGYIPPAFRYPFEGEITLQNQATARQTFYDAAVERYLAGAAQFVILGAGFDTRALRLPKSGGLRAFEVDTPETLAIKQKVLKEAGVDAAGVTFVGADFQREDWFGRLTAAGFDPRQPALFVWEGVTPYLERAAVEATLRKIAGGAAGSVVVFDCFTTEVLESQSPYLRVVRASLRAGGEPLRFGLDSTPPLEARLAELLQSCGLALEEQRTLGKETDGQCAWGGFVVASVRSDNR